MIVAIILFIFGESSVKGFATMLIISIIVTFLVMVYLNRYILSRFVRSEKFENNKEEIFKIKQILNVSPQETAIAPNLTVKENLEFMAGVYQISNKEKKIDNCTYK